jgi:hypothetical protein
MVTDARIASLREFLDGTSRVPERLVEDWTARFREGKRTDWEDAHARYLLRDFVTRQWLQQPHSPAMLAWLADAIDAILDNAKPLDALSLKPQPAHRPADEKTEVRITLWVAATQTRGYTRKEAIAHAADLFSKDVKTVGRYLKSAEKWAAGRNANADWEEFFLTMTPPRPLPPRKDGK